MAQIIADGVKVHDDIELILFDKDGTLIDIHHYWTSMIKIRASLIVSRFMPNHPCRAEIEAGLAEALGVDLSSGRMKPDGPVGIKPRPYIVNTAADHMRGYGADVSNDDIEHLFVEVDNDTSADLLPLLRLLPGVTSLLERLKQCHVAMAVVSTDITRRTRKAMEVLGIEHYFCDILGGDAVKNTKPEPDLAELVISKGCFANRKTLVVGDHPVDIQMGSKASVGANIGVLTGLSDRMAFDDYECHIVTDLNSLEVRV